MLAPFAHTSRLNLNWLGMRISASHGNFERKGAVCVNILLIGL